MPFDIRAPKIDASDPMRQLAQVKSFLIQLVEQLNIALRTLEGGAATSKAETSAKKEAPQTAPIAFGEIKALIIKSSDIIEAYYEKMSPWLEQTLSDGITEHNAAVQAHTDIRTLIAELTEKINSLEGGEDGVSPTVAISKVGTVTTITITDVNGSKTATINDGETGAPGPQGEKGDSGVYVGSGDMPDGYNIQIDPEGSDVSRLVLSVNGVEPDINGNVSIQTGGGGLTLSAIDLLIDILQHANYTEDMSSQIELLAHELMGGGSLIITDDGNGNVIITVSGDASITDDGAGNVVIISGGTSITDDGNGNVVIA